jgi:hypothetical protein
MNDDPNHRRAFELHLVCYVPRQQIVNATPLFEYSIPSGPECIQLLLAPDDEVHLSAIGTKGRGMLLKTRVRLDDAIHLGMVLNASERRSLAKLYFNGRLSARARVEGQTGIRVDTESYEKWINRGRNHVRGVKLGLFEIAAFDRELTEEQRSRLTVQLCDKEQAPREAMWFSPAAYGYAPAAKRDFEMHGVAKRILSN